MTAKSLVSECVRVSEPCPGGGEVHRHSPRIFSATCGRVGYPCCAYQNRRCTATLFHSRFNQGLSHRKLPVISNLYCSSSGDCSSLLWRLASLLRVQCSKKQCLACSPASVGNGSMPSFLLQLPRLSVALFRQLGPFGLSAALQRQLVTVNAPCLSPTNKQ